MPQLSFITSCIEFYAEHTNRASTEIYSLFASSGLWDWLRSDYEDLHGLSFEYLMGLFDEFLQPQEKNVTSLGEINFSAGGHPLYR